MDTMAPLDDPSSSQENSPTDKMSKESQPTEQLKEVMVSESLNNITSVQPREPLKEVMVSESLNNISSVASSSTTSSQNVSKDDLEISRVPVVCGSSEAVETVTPTVPVDSNVSTVPTQDSLEEFKAALKTLESCSEVAFKNIEERASLSNAMAKDKSNSTKDLMLLHGKLKDYQKRGVQWMWSVYYNGCEGAILGDEMGLGKTIQLIAFLCKVIEEQVPEPNLIVCPLSVLNNWVAEFKKFAPQIQIIKYYGNKNERNVLKKKLSQPGVQIECSASPPGPRGSKSFVKLRLPHIIVTTPQIIDKDYNFLKKKEWNCIIVDEGHSVKNNLTKFSMQLSSMKSIFKVILTGTPLQNNLKELWTLLEFVQPNNTFELDKFEKLLADRLSTLTSDTAGDVTDQGVADILNTLHNILKPFFLRRTKKDVNLNLPLKKTVVIDCPLVLEQKDIYTSVLTKTLSVNRNKDELVSLKTEPSDEDDETPLINVNTPLVKDMNTPLVKDMNTPLVKNMDTPLVKDMNTPLVKDMNTPLVKDMNTPLVKDMVSRKRKADSIDLDESSSSSGSSRKRRKCSENALRHMTLFDSSDESWDDEKFEEYYQTVHMNTPTSVVPPANPDEIKFLHNYKLSNISMCLRKIINHPYLVKKPFKEINGVKEMVTDENIITKCGKMIVLNQLLAKLKETNHKVLVFSTMTKALDMIEEMCILKDYQYYRLDGTVNNELRNKSIDDFNNPKTGWSVFLISTRAGGLGLNLIGADTCINYDSDWNPQVDCQAEARCHRIGQTKPVCIYRLVSQNTLDEVIYETAQSKLRLGHIVLPPHLFKFEAIAKDQQKVDLNELLRQIRMETKDNRVRPDGNIYTDAEIEKFLDRSDLM